MINSKIVVFANTFIAKPGNIGVRMGKVLDELARQNRAAICVCRGAVKHAPTTQYLAMGWLGYVPRILNAVRIYLRPSFNHRLLDIALFEYFANRQLDRLLKKGTYKIAHVWDTCPRLIRRLKSEGIYVVLDVPIAPITYGRRMRHLGRAPFLLDDQRLIDIEIEAFNEANQLIAPSAFVADELVLAGVQRERITVVEFGVDVPVLATCRLSSDPIKEKGIDFCMVGVVNRRKGVLELLDAWTDPAFAEDRLHLCGRVFPEVAARITACTRNNILTPGFINPFSYLLNCDVFVFPSWIEGSAKAVYEAMACGLPVITTYSSGSIVRDGVDGFVIDAGDVAALKQKMLWFKEHPERIGIMGQAARERVKEFTWTRYAQRIINIYDQ